MNSKSTGAPAQAALCPLCGGPNGCQRCTAAACTGPCWCKKATIPEALRARVPAELRNRACICPACVEDFHRAQRQNSTPGKVLPGDFYFEGGLMIFTAAWHWRRGYCCGSGCRHCPY